MLIVYSPSFQTPSKAKSHPRQLSFPIPLSGDLGVPHLFLQLEDAIHESLGSWRACHEKNAISKEDSRVLKQVDVGGYMQMEGRDGVACKET